MNKLMGFYELRELSIPTIPWKEYFPGVELSDEFLWTIRSAVNHGDDLNLPRLVGKTAGEATTFADNLYKQLYKKGMVVYYPYFVAQKSGTLNIHLDKIYASPLIRTRKTALAVAGGRDIEIKDEPGIIELNGGVVEGKPFKEIMSLCIPTDKTVDKKYRLQLKMLDDIKKKLEVKENE